MKQLILLSEFTKLRSGMCRRVDIISEAISASSFRVKE